MGIPQAKDLFQLQTELVDTKVDMAVSKAIDRVLERIDDLNHNINNDITQLKNTMDERFVHLEKHFTKIEHRVNSTKNSLRTLNRVLGQVQTKFIEYCFRAIAFTSGAVVLYAISQLRYLIK